METVSPCGHGTASSIHGREHRHKQYGSGTGAGTAATQPLSPALRMRAARASDLASALHTTRAPRIPKTTETVAVRAEARVEEVASRTANYGDAPAESGPVAVRRTPAAAMHGTPSPRAHLTLALQAMPRHEPGPASEQRTGSKRRNDCRRELHRCTV
jgi:hypothetical protein